MPLLFLLAGRNNVLTALTGIPYQARLLNSPRADAGQRWRRLHIGIDIVIVVLIALHAICFSATVR